METGFVKAVLSGDSHAIFGAIAAMALSVGAAWFLALLTQKGAAVLDEIQARWASLKLGQLTLAGDRFFEAMRKAIANHVALNAAIAESVADGTISDAEWRTLAAAAWADFQNGLGARDWKEFAALFFPAGWFAPKRSLVEEAAYRKFMANARHVASEVAGTTIVQRAMRKRAMEAAGVVGIDRSYAGVIPCGAPGVNVPNS